jgi:predicted transcriptional regulator
MYQMTEAEHKLADLIWDEEPVGSGELVKFCSDRFAWKKSTTYTFLKKLCEQGIFKNDKSQVTSCVSRDAYLQQQGEAFVEKTFNGSLPKMIAAFMEHKSLTDEQVDEIQQMIDDYKHKV